VKGNRHPFLWRYDMLAYTLNRNEVSKKQFHIYIALFLLGLTLTYLGISAENSQILKWETAYPELNDEPLLKIFDSIFNVWRK
jgi:hypothetical protein